MVFGAFFNKKTGFEICGVDWVEHSFGPVQKETEHDSRFFKWRSQCSIIFAFSCLGLRPTGISVFRCQVAATWQTAIHWRAVSSNNLFWSSQEPVRVAGSSRLPALRMKFSSHTFSEAVSPLQLHISFEVLIPPRFEVGCQPRQGSIFKGEMRNPEEN